MICEILIVVLILYSIFSTLMALAYHDQARDFWKGWRQCLKDWGEDHERWVEWTRDFTARWLAERKTTQDSIKIYQKQIERMAKRGRKQ